MLLLLEIFSQGSKILETNLLGKISNIREQDYTCGLGGTRPFENDQERRSSFDFSFSQGLLSINTILNYFLYIFSKLYFLIKN